MNLLHAGESKLCLFQLMKVVVSALYNYPLFTVTKVLLQD